MARIMLTIPQQMDDRLEVELKKTGDLSKQELIRSIIRKHYEKR